MPNRLSESPSPYLRQHAENPVDWYPWGPEALEKAKAEQKPIFLSIGYSACHWCHVMKRESFQHQETADIMNKLYINIKVDREERPDLDKIYLQSLMLIIGGAGWPMNMWLTPDLKPYHGATYLPHIPHPGVPSLAQQLLFLADAWKSKREDVEASADRVTLVLQQMSDVKAPPLAEGVPWLDEAVRGCELRYDDKNGGFGQAPKFPQPLVLRYLLLRAIDTEDAELLELVDHTAQSMGRGGIYDQLGGGFHRYSVDAEWDVPHFEKMLYDNAQLCSFYAELFAHTKKPFYKWVVDSLVLWLERDMTLEDGGFCSSSDAESEEIEGRAFVWTLDQLAEVLDENERQMFAYFFNVTKAGNFSHGASVLTQRKPISKCAKGLGWDFELAVRVLNSAREKAFEAREERVQPEVDDKVVLSWNAQMVSALCHATRLAGTEEAPGMALKAGQFLLQHFGQKNEGGCYPRVWSQGQAYGQALAEDLGSLALAFFDLYELTLDDKWFSKAAELYQVLVADYWDPEKQLTAQTSPTTTDIPFRPYVFEDNPAPSGHSLFAECSRRYCHLTGDTSARERLEVALQKVAPVATQAPTSLGYFLRTAHLHERSPAELVLGGTGDQAKSFLDALGGRLRPDLLVAASGTPGLNPELAEGREPGKAYLCENFSCKMPAESTEELVALLDG
jgi:uncharacterized protein